MKYRLKIYDNFHYMDEEESYLYGEFATAGEALEKAKSIVEEFIVQHYKTGMKAEALYSEYMQYGEDPVVVEESGGKITGGFSAWKYAREFAQQYVEKNGKR